MPEAIHPNAPRTEGGYAWGFSVRRCGSLSSLFTSSPYPDGYDISIGTSERALSLNSVFPPSRSETLDFQHLLVVFGGPRGLERAAMNDPELEKMGISGTRTRELFDHWVNVLPNQGTRSIRTEEAMLIGLAGLKRLWDLS
jgi:methyltransferase